jgi:uncharacterized cupredoxin-like copper-binding protein
MATQWQRWAAAAVLATVGMGLGACGGGSDDKSSADGKEKDNPVVSAPSAVGGAGSKIEVSGKEFSYSPAKLTLKAGQASTIVFKNTGTIEHDLTVDDVGFKLSVASGKSADKELKVDKPGTYEFHCTVEGHKDAGMKGELVVE